VGVVVHLAGPRFLFFFNQKVASRSVLGALRRAFPAARKLPDPALLPSMPSCPRFLVVRDPYDRVVSCWRDKCGRATAWARQGRPPQPCQRLLLEALDPPGDAGLELLGELSFADFVGLLERVRDHNGHFRLQGQVLLNANPPRGRVQRLLRSARLATSALRCAPVMPALLRPGDRTRLRLDARVLEQAPGARVQLLRLEQLDRDWPAVQIALGIPLELSWKNRTEPEHDPWTPELLARVGELYAPDFELLGYPRRVA
jgi:hypothetical protein